MKKLKTGESCQIAPSAIISSDCVLGDKVTIEDYVVIESGVSIGNGCTICAGAKIGTRPFVSDTHPDKKKNKDKIFGLIIGDNVFIGNNTIVQKGVGRDAVIGEGTFINNLCNLGHDLSIGSNCTIGLSTSISGYTNIGDNTYIAPGVTISNRVNIGNHCFVGIGSLVLSDIDEFTKVVGRPAKNINAKRKSSNFGKILSDSPSIRAAKNKLKQFTLIRKIHALIFRSPQ